MKKQNKMLISLAIRKKWSVCRLWFVALLLNVSFGAIVPVSLKAVDQISQSPETDQKFLQPTVLTSTTMTASYVQEAYFKPSDPQLEGGFGISTAISGNTAVVGASGTNAAYIFVRENENWILQARIATLTLNSQDSFGRSVAIDGNTVVIGAFNESSSATGINGNQNDQSARWAGAAYVFVRNGTTWSQQAYLKASNTGADDSFGQSVAVHGDTIIIGAPGEDSNATGVNGNQTDNSKPESGAAYVFTRSGETWSQQAYLKASNSESRDFFGSSVSVEGNVLVVGATNEDSNANAINGDQNNNTTEDSGAAYVFARSGTSWTQEAYLKPSGVQPFTYFGWSTAISGNSIAITNDINTYVFSNNGANWVEEAKIAVPLNPGTPPTFGLVTDLSSDQLIVGVRFQQEAFVYRRSGTTWTQAARLTASNSEPFDGYGVAAAIEGNISIVGASSESSGATGVNGDQTNNDVSGAGATYVYNSTPASTPTCAGLAQEAETPNAILAGFAASGDPSASGGQYITSLTSGSFYNTFNPSYKAEYCFNVPTAGTYRIKGKTYAADNFSDSFYVTIDGAPATGYLWDVLQNSVYATDYVNDRNQADPVEVQLSAGPHYVTVYLREQGTRLDTLALEQVTAPPEPTCAGLVQEAESGAVIGNWGIGNDAAASGGQYIAAPNGSGDFWNGANGSQKASYCFNVDTAGTYRIKGKVYGADTLSDSFYVQVDGAPTTGYLWDVLPNTSYTSDYVNDRNVADPVEVQLSAGQHIVNLFVREDGTRLDTIELQLVNSGPPPTPTCAGLTQEAESGAVTGNFVIGNDATASNGAYIHTPSGSGDFWNGPNARHKAEFCFNVPTAGTYRIDGRVYGADTLSDSFYVQVDGAPTNGYLWDVLPNTTYQLDSVSDRNQADPVLVPLSSGQHTVTLYAREAGTRLDTIQLVASTGSATSRALPFLAQGVGGTVHLDATGLNREVDFSTFIVTLLDAETQGQMFRQQVQADRFGRYHFDGMEPGQYIVQLAVPDDMVASASSATIDATVAEPVEVDFSVSSNRKTYLPLLNR